MKKVLSFLVAAALVLAAGLSLAEAKTVRPLPLTPDTYDLDNGVFWLGMDYVDPPVTGPLIMDLYLEARYSLSEIENLGPGGTFELNGSIYTVDLVVIHGWYDSNGDGHRDTGTITVRNPEQVKDLLAQYRLEPSDQELAPESYEIYTREDFDGYIAFCIGSDGFCHPVVNDETYRTKVGTAEVPLPLPEGFVCHIDDMFGHDDVDNGTEQDFLDFLYYGSDEYADTVRFEGGKLVEAWCCKK